MSPSASHGDITHVSDTALLVAACRALESESADGFVHDPFAARLAGDRGMAILRGLARPETMQFGIGVRSRFMDELLLQSLASKPISTVICLGCGLDTRPWRLDLSPDLRWIEVDFADMLDYKEGLMSAETPRCRRERITADVNDAAQRDALFAVVGPEPAFLITEGLLMYLPAATVEAMAAECWQKSGIVHWMSDITSSAFAKMVGMDTVQQVRDVQASDSLSGEQILSVIRQNGWSTSAHRSYITDLAFAMDRIRRTMGEPPASPPPAFVNDPTGVHCLTRV